MRLDPAEILGSSLIVLETQDSGRRTIERTRIAHERSLRPADESRGTEKGGEPRCFERAGRYPFDVQVRKVRRRLRNSIRVKGRRTPVSGKEWTSGMGARGKEHRPEEKRDVARHATSVRCVSPRPEHGA